MLLPVVAECYNMPPWDIVAVVAAAGEAAAAAAYIDRHGVQKASLEEFCVLDNRGTYGFRNTGRLRYSTLHYQRYLARCRSDDEQHSYHCRSSDTTYSAKVSKKNERHKALKAGTQEVKYKHDVAAIGLVAEESCCCYLVRW